MDSFFMENIVTSLLQQMSYNRTNEIPHRDCYFWPTAN